MSKQSCTQLPPHKNLVNAAGVGPQEWLWPNGDTITIGFLDGTSDQHNYTVEQANKWLVRGVNISFEWFVDIHESDLRISYAQEGAGWSYTGSGSLYVPDLEPTMMLGFFESKTINGELFDRIVIHEFGHALGMAHEHIHPHSGLKWKEPRKKWMNEIIDGTPFTSPYDRDSVMHYFITNEMVDNNPFTPIDVPFEISDGDYEWLNKAYQNGTVVLPPKPKINEIYLPVIQ